MDGFKAIGDFLAEYVIPIFTVTIPAAIGFLGGIFSGLIYVVKAVFDYFSFIFNLLKGVFQLFNGDTEEAVVSFKKAFGSLVSYMKNLVKAVYAPFAGLINGIIRGINAIIRAKNKLNNSNTAEINLLPTTLNFGNTPEPVIETYNASQRQRLGAASAENAAFLARQNNATLTADQQAANIAKFLSQGTGNTININAVKGMDEQQLASIVDRKLAWNARQGGAGVRQ